MKMYICTHCGWVGSETEAKGYTKNLIMIKYNYWAYCPDCSAHITLTYNEKIKQR